ncbi:MAG: sigma-70 family RNA polymerase sigma factor, partial [Polyangiaceae bacterium]|nr:sigma-70 family RNA polymerase sigma factor [Polyangiaceae bacterium]
MDMLDQSHEAPLGEGCPAVDGYTERDSYVRELTADGIPVDAVAPIDREACHRLVLSHRRMVEAMARKYSRLGATEEDLVGEGMLGLLDAARRFDPGRGTKFATYARWWVRYYMRSYLAESRRAVSMPKTRNIVRIRSWVGRTVR